MAQEACLCALVLDSEVSERSSERLACDENVFDGLPDKRYVYSYNCGGCSGDIVRAYWQLQPLTHFDFAAVERVGGHGVDLVGDPRRPQQSRHREVFECGVEVLHGKCAARSEVDIQA